jgi:hypothetical protein
MDIWMSQQEPTVVSQWTGPRSLLQEQQAIGWKQMFRGFFSLKWSQHLQFCIREDMNSQWCERNLGPDDNNEGLGEFVVHFEEAVGDSPATAWRDAHQQLAGLIKVIWAELGDLWRKHNEFIHQDGLSHHNSMQLDLCNHIRYLHKFKEKTLAAHRDKYFFPNVESYLQGATPRQMQQYIAQYRPVILNSIRQATNLATQALTIPQFPGFTVISNSTRTLHVSQEEAQHRKHTRLRNLLPSRITTYFKKKTRPATPSGPT